MPQFTYTARNDRGERIDGAMEAPSTGAVAAALDGQGLLLIRAEASAAPAPAAPGARWAWLAPRIGAVDLMMFARQLATLLKAGVPLLRSLKGLEESATNGRFAQILAELQQQLEAGRDLSTSMARAPGVFSNYVISMVRVGELTGRLHEIFKGLHLQMSFERENREQVRAALRYPMFVIAVSAAALIAVNVFVIPSFAKVYKGLKADLPMLTQVLIGISNFIVTFWPALLVAAVAAAVAARASLRTSTGRRARDGLLLRLPIVSSLIRKAALARFTKSFGLALEAGVPAVDALTVAIETADNLVLAERIAQMRTSAERGESLAQAARSTGAFTPTILQMIAVGEETGALGEMMTEVAEYYQREVDYAVKALSAQLEPLLIIFLGGFILVFALGVFLPLWDLSRVAIK